MSTRIPICKIFTMLLIWLCAARAGRACNSPLVLDLDGNGIYTIGLDSGVQFDLDGDGVAEKCGWLNPWQNDAFLWLDLNHNNEVDSGRELFGNATLLPDGSKAKNGFEALAQYDRREAGGNDDGIISPEDVVWDFLRLWIDKNHDGVASPDEVFTLDEKQIVAIRLSYRKEMRVDGNGNLKALWGKFAQRAPDGRGIVVRDVIDVYFVTSDK